MVARRALPVLIALLPVAVPATASAAFAQRDANGVLAVDGGDEQNSVTITLSGTSFMVTDQAGMGEGAGCTHIDNNTSSCTAAPVTTFSADLGNGDDTFSSTASTPAKVMGSGGEDDLTGGSGADELVGGDDNDTLHGGAGDDKLVGESSASDPGIGQNTMDGGPGNDEIDGGGGPDAIMGGADDDTENGGGGVDMVDGGDGNDAVSGGDGNDVMRGGPGSDQVGVPGHERGNDDIAGGAGDDVLDPGAGPAGGVIDDDSLAGDDGIDEVTYAGRSARVVVTIDDSSNDGAATEHDNVRSSVEKVTGSGADDELRGSPNPETLNGGRGGDTLDGGGGSDTTDGGDGDDNVSGGAGADVVTGGPGADQLNGSVAGLVGVDEGDAVAGGEGDDRIAGGDGDDLLDGGLGADDVSGGPGVDSASYATAISKVTVTLDGKGGDGEEGEGDNVQSDVENLGGWSGEDTFTGNAVANALDSGGGEDFVDGGGGADVETAGAGFDVVRARDGVADTVDCGDSSDFAIVDKSDTVAKSCERIDKGLVKRPKLGRLVLFRPLRGRNQFGLLGMHRTVPLKDRLPLPLGTTKVDATSGAVRVTSALSRGRSQFGDFSQGQFLVKQARSEHGLTEVVLTGGDLSKCAAAGARGRVSAARTVLRRLFGRAHGRFRTRGRNSTATVRGTEWSVIDRCDGTLTTVKRGTVIVRDKVKHRTVRLKSGESYLARRGNR